VIVLRWIAWFFINAGLCYAMLPRAIFVIIIIRKAPALHRGVLALSLTLSREREREARR
jgi:hypothetical protein